MDFEPSVPQMIRSHFREFSPVPPDGLATRNRRFVSISLAARAYNIVTAEYFRPFADRMTPAAIIPMHSPGEAIEELEFAVKQLGYKVAMRNPG